MSGTYKKCGCAHPPAKFYVGLAVVAVAEAAVVLAQVLLPHLFHEHSHHYWFDSVPAFGSLYGLASCVVIIIVSKFLGKVWLMRREDYYDA